jgi:dTDP-4-dehydrorhamnose reductase
MRDRQRGKAVGRSASERWQSWRGPMMPSQGSLSVDHQPPVELWAGAECTVNRVGDVYFDQLQRTGHDARPDDLDRLKQLGVSRVRFPVLWERTAPRGLATPDAFHWSDSRMRRLAALGIAPIVGLVHHGSGPRDTNLCDPRFAEGLATFAGQVAERYPWIDAYTPVNEPLTTARFSALYGLWYPHATDLGAFYRALANEVLATRTSMRAIRRVNPLAKLYATEDVAEVFSTADLADQCRYENERRWLSLDLLFGRVGARHPLRRELEDHGVDPRQLDQWCEDPCTPDLVGVNYYVTSDRFLDSRLNRYPPQTHGGNGRQTYADVEAVRARPEGIVGHQAVLASVWKRYRAPCALTEVHLAGHREDQLRWLTEAWQAARAARSGGADVRAVTVWSVFGAVGWNNLVTRDAGELESGAYDVRSPEPRATALVALARGLSLGDAAIPLPAQGVGWWRSNSRLTYAVERADEQTTRPHVLVIGAGAFARQVADVCAQRFACIAVPALGLARRELTLTRRAPWALILALDPTSPALNLDVELDEHAPSILAHCAPDLRVLAVSSERVYDGWSTQPFRESDGATPADAEGEAWVALERKIAQSFPRTLIVRCGASLDSERGDAPLMRILDALRRGQAVHIPDDRLVSPTWTPHLVHAALDLSIDGERGIWHLVPRATCSALDLVRRFAACAGVPFTVDVTSTPASSARGPMRALASERGWPLPELEATIGIALESFRQRLETGAARADLTA